MPAKLFKLGGFAGVCVCDELGRELASSGGKLVIFAILSRVTSQSTSQGLERAANLCRPNVRAALSLLSVLSRNVRGENGNVFHLSTSPLASARILSTGTAEALLTPAEDFRHSNTSGIFRRLHGAESTIAKPALPLGMREWYTALRYTVE